MTNLKIDSTGKTLSLDGKDPLNLNKQLDEMSDIEFATHMASMRWKNETIVKVQQDSFMSKLKCYLKKIFNFN